MQSPQYRIGMQVIFNGGSSRFLGIIKGANITDTERGWYYYIDYGQSNPQSISEDNIVEVLE